jgi:hypothetical protein
MKRLLPIVILSLAGAMLAADETTEVYRRIYLEAESLKQKYSAILDIVRLKNSETAPILAEALDDLLRAQESYQANTEKALFSRTVRLIVTALGEYKYEDAASSVWDASQQVPDALVKSESLIAIGKMRALPYAERIALRLRDLNLKPTVDTDAGEKEAYGAILALERLKDPRGFEPVFFAIDAWYSRRVRQQAERSLPNISEDPTDAIKGILQAEAPGRMMRALKAEIASKAAQSRKAETALLALELGHSRAARDKEESRVLGDIRKLALRSLITFAVRAPEPVAPCLASYEAGVDDEEKLLGLQALGVNGSDPAARALSDIITKLDAEQRAGLGSENRNRMAKAAIENAALTHNPIVRPALILVAANDAWSGGIILAAKKAQEALK